MEMMKVRVTRRRICTRGVLISGVINRHTESASDNIGAAAVFPWYMIEVGGFNIWWVVGERMDERKEEEGRRENRSKELSIYKYRAQCCAPLLGQ